MFHFIRNQFYETPKELLDASVQKQNEIRGNTDDVLITAENLWLPETYSVAQAMVCAFCIWIQLGWVLETNRE